MKSGLFSELYDLLAQYKLGHGREFDSISARNQEALSGRIALYFRNNLSDIVRLVEESKGIALRFDNYNPKWERLGKISRKAVFYSDVSLVLLAGRIQVRAPGFRASGRKQSRKLPKQVSATNVSGLVSTLFKIRPLVERGVLVPVPSEIELDQSQEHISPETIAGYNAIIDAIKKDELENVVVPVLLDEWRIRRQIEEIREISPGVSDLRPLHIYLPHLSNVSTETLLSMREDNYEAFMRFQQALREFLLASAKVRSEQAFLELAHKVDYEIRELKSRVDTIGDERRRKGWEISSGLIASSVTLVVDAEIARYLSAVIGSKTVFDGLKFLLGRRNAYKTLEGSDYYLAYKVHELSARASEVKV